MNLQQQGQEQELIIMDFHQVRDDDEDVDFPSPPQTPSPYNRSGVNYIDDSESILQLDKIRRIRQEEERSSSEYFLHFHINNHCDVSQAASIPASPSSSSNKHKLDDEDDCSMGEETSRKRQCHGLCLSPTSPLLLPMISSSASSFIKSTTSNTTPTTNRTTRAVSMDEDRLALLQKEASSDSSSESDDSSIVQIMTPVMRRHRHQRARESSPKSHEYALRPRRSLHLSSIIDIDSLAINEEDTTTLCRNNCSTNKSYKYFAEYDDNVVMDNDMAVIASMSSRDDDLPYMPLY